MSIITEKKNGNSATDAVNDNVVQRLLRCKALAGCFDCEVTEVVFGLRTVSCRMCEDEFLGMYLIRECAVTDYRDGLKTFLKERLKGKDLVLHQVLLRVCAPTAQTR